MNRVVFSIFIGLCLVVLNDAIPAQPKNKIQCITSQNHVITFGTKRPDDVLLHKEHAMGGSKEGKIVSYPFLYPRPGDVRGKISYIEAVDLTEEEPGCVVLKSGGVGFTHVSLALKSRKSSKLDYVVEVYGKRFPPR